MTHLHSILDGAIRLANSSHADGVVALLGAEVDWKILLQKTKNVGSFVVATTESGVFESAKKGGVRALFLEHPEASIQDQLSQAILMAVAQELISSGSTIVAVYGWFDQELPDTISIMSLGERLGRLSAADLRKLETEVPLETLRVVVDLAVEIGREGREGKPIGTMFVVGDHRKVLKQSRPAGFDLVKGYSRAERNLLDLKIHESLKEISQMDGAFVVAADGTIEACCRLIDTTPVEVTMTRGLGSRHFAAAAISKNTKAIAVVVSQSGGTVRLYQNGEVVLRIESLTQPMKWTEIDPAGE